MQVIISNITDAKLDAAKRSFARGFKVATHSHDSETCKHTLILEQLPSASLQDIMWAMFLLAHKNKNIQFSDVVIID